MIVKLFDVSVTYEALQKFLEGLSWRQLAKVLEAVKGEFERRNAEDVH